MTKIILYARQEQEKTEIISTRRSVGVLQGLLEASKNNSELKEDGQKIEGRGDQQRIEKERRSIAGQENEVEGGRRRVRRDASLGNGLGEKEKDATLRDIRCGKWFGERAQIIGASNDKNHIACVSFRA